MDECYAGTTKIYQSLPRSAAIATARIMVTFAFTGSSKGLGIDVNRLERRKSIKRSPEEKSLLCKSDERIPSDKEEQIDMA